MSLNDGYEIVFLLSLLVHLYPSYLLVGGFPMMVVTTWLGRMEGQSHLTDLAQKMRRVGPRVMILSLALGVLLGLVVYGRYGRHVFYIMDVFQVGYGLLLILLALAFWGIYAYKTKYALSNTTFSTQILMGGGIVVCLLGVTLLFVVAHVMMLHPDYSESMIQKGLSGSLTLPTVWPRFFHIVLGSVAATGMMITLYGSLRPFNFQITRYGVGWTLAGTLPQIVVGPWLLVALPDEVRTHLVDGASLSSLVFFASLTFALIALVLLNAALMAPHVRGLVWTGLGSLFLTFVFMVMVREEVRTMWMQSYNGADAYQELSWPVVLGVVIMIGLGFLALGLVSTRRWLNNSSLQKF